MNIHMRKQRLRMFDDGLEQARSIKADSEESQSLKPLANSASSLVLLFEQVKENGRKDAWIGLCQDLLSQISDIHKDLLECGSMPGDLTALLEAFGQYESLLENALEGARDAWSSEELRLVDRDADRRWKDVMREVSILLHRNTLNESG
ncbi:SubName: Full=Uncharacterized protein {ECO:0000313/EMBL:CCA75193.1} [Serendipita indica DSM 11827]|uniref:Uncharacterized protein n=1 Tax=Serendipita indica (strain DSM 11827) TaxID=1109443 RepID=G4TV50_SERID|nr:SubName: Full=Uncharacterized protein {ECO:0000313/EMBL:CCA75193.1} [Serendipita indica DSM 11827]CCA75193.1 hypothetical protein PIIN_09177 [Serendipita indica DSM 11827]